MLRSRQENLNQSLEGSGKLARTKRTGSIQAQAALQQLYEQHLYSFKA